MKPFIGFLKFVAFTVGATTLFLLTIITAIWLMVAYRLPDVNAPLPIRPSSCPAGTNGLIKLADLPAHAVAAYIAAEQPEYWSQRGTASLRAAGDFAAFPLRWGLGLEQPKRQPPLSMELARLQLASPNIGHHRTLIGHLRLWVQSERMEWHFDKREVLERHLNHIYFGRGTIGYDCAAHEFLGKPVSDLDIAESALLAALPRSPNTYDPAKHPVMALERRNLIIEELRANGDITDAEATVAIRQELPGQL